MVTQPLDDTSVFYPPSPGGGAFFWRWGLGNWFVSTPQGRTVDAEREEIDGAPVWKVSVAQATSADLWAQLNHLSGGPIDLSAYSGIAFETRLTGTSTTLVVAFNANGDVDAGDGASPMQQLGAADVWQPHQLSFQEARADAASISSVDFIVSASAVPFELRLRDLALLCKQTCP